MNTFSNISGSKMSERSDRLSRGMSPEASIIPERMLKSMTESSSGSSPNHTKFNTLKNQCPTIRT